MLTGNYRFETRPTKRRWFKGPRTVEVLMVEVDEPIDLIGNRSTFWVPATSTERHAYEGQLTKIRVDRDMLRAEVDRLRARLEVSATLMAAE